MTARRVLAVAFAALALTGCGRQAELIYPPGSTGPTTAAGEAEPPTPTELITPTTQARPARSDEVLRNSQTREPDPFDLPPSR